MRWNTFARSLAFAAIAAAGSAAWILCAAPVVGARLALTSYLVAVTAAYGGGLATTRRRQLTAAIILTLAGIGLFVVTPGLRELIVGLAVLIGVARSGFLHPRRPARAVVTEAALVIGGLLFVQAIAGASLRGAILGVWGFFLVQSLFFLIPGARTRSTADPARDPFDAACASAVALLDRGFV